MASVQGSESGSVNAETGGTEPADSGLIARLEEALGVEHVCASAEALDRYSNCTIPWQSRCRVVVFPGSVSDVQAVMRTAAKFGLPLWPFSTGRNWGYGATMAVDDGAIIMVLSRMNRVIEVNEELAYAVIEPGVTYEQLNDYLKSQGHKLWADCIDGTSQGSVIGNALDRGVGETPYGDHFGCLCGLEVVLADGEVIRTGGAMSGLKTWNVHKWGLGPVLEGLFSQSNLGVVTRAGIWLMPEPESYCSFAYEIKDEKHLPEVLDRFRQLALQGVTTSKLHMLNAFVAISVVTQRKEEVAGTATSRLSEDELAHLQRKYGLSAWSFSGGLYGTAAQIRVQKQLLSRALKPYGRLLYLTNARQALIDKVVAVARHHRAFRGVVELLAQTSLPVIEMASKGHDILRGIPTEYFVRHAYFLNRRTRPEQEVNPAADNCGLIWFAPILPFTSSEIVPYLAKCRASFEAFDTNFYVASLMMNPRAVICLMGIIYDRDDPASRENAAGLYRELIRDMHASQYQQYRAGLASWDENFTNAPELSRVNRRLKAALDPGNVIAPGRYGV